MKADLIKIINEVWEENNLHSGTYKIAALTAMQRLQEIYESKMKTIKWITEAYSMQPYKFHIGGKYSKMGSMEKVTLNRIEFQIGKEFGYYHGYDKDNNLLFSYIENSVNVGFF